MRYPILVSNSADQFVKLLLIGVSLAFGALLSWRILPTVRPDTHAEAARLRARMLADALLEHSMASGSCTYGLALLAEDAEHGWRQGHDDPWGRGWKVQCHGSLIVVKSAGSDGRWHTADDVVALASTAWSQPPPGEFSADTL